MSPGPGTCGWRGGCILARRIPVLAQRRARRPRIFDERDAFAEHLSRRMDVGVSENMGTKLVPCEHCLRFRMSIPNSCCQGMSKGVHQPNVNPGLQIGTSLSGRLREIQ